jgi:hypothetical protein
MGLCRVMCPRTMGEGVGRLGICTSNSSSSSNADRQTGAPALHLTATVQFTSLAGLVQSMNMNHTLHTLGKLPTCDLASPSPPRRRKKKSLETRTELVRYSTSRVSTQSRKESRPELMRRQWCAASAPGHSTSRLCV